MFRNISIDVAFCFNWTRTNEVITDNRIISHPHTNFPSGSITLSTTYHLYFKKTMQ